LDLTNLEADDTITITVAPDPSSVVIKRRIARRDAWAGLDDQTNKSLGAFSWYLESGFYEIRWLTDMGDRIVAVYFTNEQYIQLTSKFNEVVVMDATYKTN
jgi:hypothetical protein